MEEEKEKKLINGSTNKLMIAVISGVIILIITQYISFLSDVAYSGSEKASKNAEKIAVLEARLGTIKDDTQEIKQLLKRQIP